MLVQCWRMLELRGHQSSPAIRFVQLPRRTYCIGGNAPADLDIAHFALRYLIPRPVLQFLFYYAMANNSGILLSSGAEATERGHKRGYRGSLSNGCLGPLISQIHSYQFSLTHISPINPTSSVRDCLVASGTCG